MNPVLREARIAGLRWALREIDPMHPDVPAIVVRLRQLLDLRASEPPSMARRVWQWL